MTDNTSTQPGLARLIQLILVYQPNPGRGSTQYRQNTTNVAPTLRGTVTITQILRMYLAGPWREKLQTEAKHLIFSIQSRLELHYIVRIPQWWLQKNEITIMNDIRPVQSHQQTITNHYTVKLRHGISRVRTPRETSRQTGQ